MVEQFCRYTSVYEYFSKVIAVYNISIFITIIFQFFFQLSKKNSHYIFVLSVKAIKDILIYVRFDISFKTINLISQMHIYYVGIIFWKLKSVALKQNIDGDYNARGPFNI